MTLFTVNKARTLQLGLILLLGSLALSVTDPRSASSMQRDVKIEEQGIQLKLDRDKQIDTNEAILVDQRSARLLTIEERAAVPLWGQEIVNLASVSASSSFRMDRSSTCWSMSRGQSSIGNTCLILIAW